MPTKGKQGSDVQPRGKSSPEKPTIAAKPKPNNSNGATPSNGNALRTLYSFLLRCRLVEEHVQKVASAQGLASEYDFEIGQESIVVGATVGLQAEDTITSSHRHLSALIARGLPLPMLLVEKSRRNASGKPSAGSITLASLPEDPFNLGTGIALAQKLENKQHVVVAFCEQQSRSLDAWPEAWKFAAAHKLPILYVIKTGAADGSASANQAEHLAEFSFMAGDYGFPGIIVDGRDVVAVWRVAQESIHRARNGSGPTLIDCRMESAQDPLAHMERYMAKRNAWDDSWKKKLAAKIRSEIKQAVAAPAN